jgi:Tol biopolymer transport system component
MVRRVAVHERDATWSPDRKYIVFNSRRLGRYSLFMRASDGSGVDVPLVKSETEDFTVAAWSRADVMIFNVFNKDHASDLWTLSMSGDRSPKVFLSSKHSELNGTFSPDGRWVAYQSDASGRYSGSPTFPNKEPAQTISRDGGMYPRWRGDGKELFFLSPDGTMMAAGLTRRSASLRVCLKCCFGNRSGSSATTILTQSTGTASAFSFRSLPIHESPPSWIGGRYSPGEQRVAP